MCLCVCSFCLKGWVLKIKSDLLDLKYDFSPHPPSISYEQGVPAFKVHPVISRLLVGVSMTTGCMHYFAGVISNAELNKHCYLEFNCNSALGSESRILINPLSEALMAH